MAINLTSTKVRAEMGMPSRLTNAEKAKIDVLHSTNNIRQKIADIIVRCKSAVNKHLARNKDKKESKIIGSPQVLSEGAQQSLTKIARKDHKTARKVISRIPVQVSVRTEQ